MAIVEVLGTGTGTLASRSVKLPGEDCRLLRDLPQTI